MATPTTTINTPIAQNQTNTCNATLPWFVQKTEYNPAWCTFRPLVNGEEAFGAVYDAILGAKHSVDIICWGFQPSMYFRRGSGGTRAIGDLLVYKGKQNVKVRLLCWHDDWYLSQLGETNMPGDNFETYVKMIIPDWVYRKIPLLSHDYQTVHERLYDTAWYYCANLNNVTMLGSWTETAARKLRWLTQYPLTFSNVEFATRDFPLMERLENAWRLYLHGKDSERDPRTKIMNSVTTAAVTPTHHQKMVLIDYEDPNLATGFVMGHNMLDQYWDKNDHSAKRNEPDQGRNGPYPWQDVSSRVTGPILQYLNENFCQAWDKATGQSLAKSRAGMDKQLKIRPGADAGATVMAQVLRTQSQKETGKKDVADIEKMYLQAVNNATKCIFIQNQYFRFVPLATQIKQAVTQQIKCGRDPAYHGPIHLFVITNSSDDAVGPGTYNTYRMLDALGQLNAMPGVTRAVQNTSLDEQQESLETQLATEQATWQRIQSQGANPFDGSASGLASAYQQSQQNQMDLQQRINEITRQKQVNANADPVKDSENRDVPSMNVTGLKVHVCTLVAPDSPPGGWVPVYVHAKLMTIDDAFTTLGSANLNSRSMENDSELNICTDHADVAQSLRSKLWALHTKGQGAQENSAEAFDSWSDIIANNVSRENQNLSPSSSLVGFLRTSPAISRTD